MRPATLLKKKPLAQVFSCEFCEISNNTFFTEHLRATASVCCKKILCTLSRSRLVQTLATTIFYSILRWNKWKKSFADEISTCNAIKERLKHRCLPGKFAKFLRTHFSTEQFRWLLLNKPKRSLWFIVWRSDAVVS